MIGTISWTSSRRGFECGAPSSIPMKDARGNPRLEDSRFSESWGSWTSLVGCELEFLKDAVATNWGRWACRTDGWDDRQTKIAARCRNLVLLSWSKSIPLLLLAEARLALDFSGGPSNGLVLVISSKYLVILASPTSRCDEISGTGGGASLSLSPTLRPSLLASCFFLLLLRLPFEGIVCVTRWRPSGARSLEEKLEHVLHSVGRSEVDNGTCSRSFGQKKEGRTRPRYSSYIYMLLHYPCWLPEACTYL